LLGRVVGRRINRPKAALVELPEPPGLMLLAIRGYNAAHSTTIIIRQVQYLNSIVEQDHRGIKRVTRPMQGFTILSPAGLFAAFPKICDRSRTSHRPVNPAD
jgi:transposase-like protein